MKLTSEIFWIIFYAELREKPSCLVRDLFGGSFVLVEKC